MTLSFSAPELGLEANEAKFICSGSFNFSALEFDFSYGGPSGFFYTHGIDFGFEEGIEVAMLRFHIRGFEETTTSAKSIDELRTICENFPEQCFANIIIKKEGKFYGAVSYEAIPYQVSLRDSSAQQYEYQFLADEHRLECVENWNILPIRFQYDGYLYTSDRRDSLRISGLDSEFFVRQTY